MVRNIQIIDAIFCKLYNMLSEYYTIFSSFSDSIIVNEKETKSLKTHTCEEAIDLFWGTIIILCGKLLMLLKGHAVQKWVFEEQKYFKTLFKVNFSKSVNFLSRIFFFNSTWCSSFYKLSASVSNFPPIYMMLFT